MNKRVYIRKILQVVCLVLLIIYACTGDVSAEKKEVKQKRVLFISSYSYAWETVPEQIDGIQSALDDDVTLDYKFMDTKNSTSKKSEKLFYKSIKQYLSEVPAYDALIVGDDAAFQFAIKYQRELFSGIPIAFEAVNDVAAATEASKNSMITGVVETLSYKNTISLATKLYPNAKNIVAVLDDTITGQSERKEFYKFEKEFPKLNFKEINVSMATQVSIISQLEAIDEESILLYVMCSEDADENNYIGNQGIKLVSEAASVPMFSIVSIGMGHGVFGGEFVSQKEMGRIAGEMVQKYLDGAAFSDIKMETDSPKMYCFDENVMNKFEITADDLPKGVEIINHRQTFIERNIDMIRISIVIGIILLVILAILLIDNVHKSRLNHMLEKTKRSLTKAVRYDHLTGIYNRSVFLETLEKKIAAREAFALVLFDVDHFKNINDTLGHNNGDVVLKEIGVRIKALTDEKISVYRLAGDEFTAIISSKDEVEIEQYLDKLKGVFSKPFILCQEEYDIHSSIGAAMFPQDAKNQTDLIAAADQAMYQVKKNGRNSFMFYHQI